MSNNSIDISHLVDRTTIDKCSLDSNGEYTVKEIDAFELLSPKRIDLIAKYMYLFFEQNSIKSNFAQEIYKKHIDVFSDGKFYEPGSDSKKSYEDFLAEYDDIFKSIKENGFDDKKSLIPMSSDGMILNGAHRTATSMFLNKKVKVLDIGKTPHLNYNYEYFKRGCMSTDQLDFLALNYVKLSKKTIYAVCLWPRAVKMGKIKQCEEIISKYASIVYKKEAPLSKVGLKNFMMHLYGAEKWIGTGKNNYVGAYGKVDLCYSKADSIVYFIEGGSLDEILELKKEIRNIYKIGKHSVHITDNNNESMIAAELLLTKSGVFALNNGYSSGLSKEIEKIKDTYNSKHILSPAYTLMYFGRNTNDMNLELLECSDLDKDVVYDTNNYFYYRGYRFIDPKYAMEICERKYVKEFGKIITANKAPIKNRISENNKKITYKVKRNARRVLRKMGILDSVRQILEKKK